MTWFEINTVALKVFIEAATPAHAIKIASEQGFENHLLEHSENRGPGNIKGSSQHVVVAWFDGAHYRLAPLQDWAYLTCNPISYVAGPSALATNRFLNARFSKKKAALHTPDPSNHFSKEEVYVDSLGVMQPMSIIKVQGIPRKVRCEPGIQDMTGDDVCADADGALAYLKGRW